MIRHTVLFKLNEGFTREDEQVLAATEALTAYGAANPLVQSWETHWCFGERPVSHDFLLVCETADEAGLRAYLDDPQHREVAARLGRLFTLAVADYAF